MKNSAIADPEEDSRGGNPQCLVRKILPKYDKR
jgi:hypothetical protein